MKDLHTNERPPRKGQHRRHEFRDQELRGRELAVREPAGRRRRRHRHRRRGLGGARRVALAAVAMAVMGMSLTVVLATSALSGVRSGGSGSGRQQIGQPGPDGVSGAFRRSAPVAASAAPQADPSASAPSPGALRTSCSRVAHIGDSTSVGMVSPDFLPDPAQRLAAQYARVGVASELVDASDGRSIVENLPGQVNGYGVARAWAAQGFRGCWVFALGTNDTGNVAAGSPVGIMARIQEMMSVAGGQPVMWVNIWTLLGSGPFSQAQMQTWNQTLLQACSKYPNMRVFDWAAVVQPSWFAPDGIHYTSAGYAARASAVADALARAFPYGRSASGCVVT